MMKKQYLLILILALFTIMPLSAKRDKEQWQPTAEWPFVYQEFQDAMITTTSGLLVKGKADIHVGNHYLCYENKNKKKVVAKEGTISRVAFSNGDIYIAVDNKLCKVILEDTIQGQLCRIYRSDEVDKERYNELARINNMGMMTLDLGITGLNDMYSSVAENEGANRIEDNPLPMNTFFYFLYKGDTFPATESNILKHLDKKERSAYRAFTRSAEIIYSNQSSIFNIWSSFLDKE